jgi:hypothetical protein
MKLATYKNIMVNHGRYTLCGTHCKVVNNLELRNIIVTGRRDGSGQCAGKNSSRSSGIVLFHSVCDYYCLQNCVRIETMAAEFVLYY